KKSSKIRDDLCFISRDFPFLLTLLPVLGGKVNKFFPEILIRRIRQTNLPYLADRKITGLEKHVAPNIGYFFM
ncbi:MAG: hypothetical protein ABIQ93_16060, partial [Saprospiraceae bacterium]